MVPHGKVKNIPLLAFFIFVHVFFIPCFAQPKCRICSATKNYTLSSSYEKHRNSLLQIFALKTSKDGYYISSLGSGDDGVYGQAWCRGDVTRKDCQDCVADASRELIKLCPGNREADLWYEKCQVQYSYSPDFSATYAGKFPNSNDRENKVVNHPDQFKIKLTDLMKNLAKETYGAKSTFATRKAKLESTTIYALSQCVRNITRDSCETCLNKALGELIDCCGDRQGGTVFSRSCNVRFSVNKFYRETTNGSVKMWMVVTITTGSTLAIVVLIGCYYYLGSQKMENNTDDDSSQNVILHSMGSSDRFVITEESNIVSGQDLPYIEFAIIKAATENFSEYHKLGQGGFGTVYKGVLPNGMNIAVKRL